MPKIKTVCEKVLGNNGMTPGLISAFGWVNSSIAQYWIKRFLSASNPQFRYLGIAVCSICRFDPEQYLTDILRNTSDKEQPQLLARALRLAGELKRFDLLPEIERAIGSKNKSVAFRAIWSALSLAMRATFSCPKAKRCSQPPNGSIRLSTRSV